MKNRDSLTISQPQNKNGQKRTGIVVHHKWSVLSDRLALGVHRSQGETGRTMCGMVALAKCSIALGTIIVDFTASMDTHPQRQTR